MSKLLKRIIAIFVITAFVIALPKNVVASVSVKAKLDSVQLLMGNMTMLNLEVVADKGVKGEFPLFKQRNEMGIIPIMNDSVELRGIAQADTLDLGSGRIQMNFKVPLQSFDSGVYHLPPIQYVVGKDTFNSDRVVLKVVPVIVGENEEIEGYMSVAEPLNPSIFDKLPDAIVDYWWVILVILLIIAVLIYVAIKLKKDKPLIPKKIKILSPYEKAIQSMQILKDQKLWEQGLERDYFTRLTEILRQYLQDRFNVNALEMTSEEIIRTVSTNDEIKKNAEYIKQILGVADFVKFAKMRPLPSDNIQSFDNAMRFIEETKPEEKVEENNNEEDKRKEDKR